MMKKRFFDVGLYLDGLRQLRIIGVMMFVILELEAILMPLCLNERITKRFVETTRRIKA